MEYTILFDGGGNATLITPDYCHCYDNMQQLADDVRAIDNGLSTHDWEWNQPEFRRDPHWSDIIVTSDMVAENRAPSTGGKALGLFLEHYTS